MADYVIPSSRCGQYSANVYQGVVGGIPSYAVGANIMDYGGVADGVTSNNSAFAAALAACSNDQAVIFPEGEFMFNSQIGIGMSTSRRAIRGAGMDATILKFSSSGGVVFGGDGSFGSPSYSPHSTITGGLTKGSTTLTVTDASAFVAGRMARIILVDETNTPVVSVYNYTGNLRFMVWVVSKAGNTLTITPPIAGDFDPDATNGAEIWQAQLASQQLCGVEDLTIDGQASGGALQSTLYMQGNCYQCWAKGVKVKNYQNYGINVQTSVMTELRQTYIMVGYGGGSNRSGLLCNTNTGLLYEDNITQGTSPAIEVNFGTVGSVFAFNFTTGAFNINHGPHNTLNLYEGNKFSGAQPDGYFGGISRETFFRNHVTRGNPVNGGYAISFKRFTRQMNLVGNLIGMLGQTAADDGISPYDGLPNINNVSYNGTAQLSAGDPWLDWDSVNNRPKQWTATLTTRTSNTVGTFTLESGIDADLNAHLSNALARHVGVRWPGFTINFLTLGTASGGTITSSDSSGPLPAEGTAVTFYPSPSGFQEKDLDVAATHLKKANYYYYVSEIPSGESIGSDTLPASLFRASKPAYFGALDWPPYDPFTPSSEAAGRIPAEVRYTGGLPPTLVPHANPFRRSGATLVLGGIP